MSGDNHETGRMLSWITIITTSFFRYNLLFTRCPGESQRLTPSQWVCEFCRGWQGDANEINSMGELEEITSSRFSLLQSLLACGHIQVQTLKDLQLIRHCFSARSLLISLQHCDNGSKSHLFFTLMAHRAFHSDICIILVYSIVVHPSSIDVRISLGLIAKTAQFLQSLSNQSQSHRCLLRWSSSSWGYASLLIHILGLIGNGKMV